MDVFRITHNKWATQLTASGYAARWNSQGFYAIYTSENCSLACLENLVHRRGLGLDADFSIMTISIPDTIKKIELQEKKLPIGWNFLDENSHLICRTFGDNWLKNQESCILIVPSVIIPNERNILINPNHRDFKKIKLKKVTPFSFDTRLK